MPVFEHTSRFPFPAEEVFAWHARPLALERLTPPWERFVVERRVGGIRDGGEVWIRQRFGGLWFRWHSRHSGYVEGRQFVDAAIRGPFPRWEHTHTVTPEGPAESTLRDHIVYTFPLSSVGELLLGRGVHRRLDRAFHYRHDTVRRDLSRHHRFTDRGPLRVAISGASGFLGSNLAAFLSTCGHAVYRLVRREADAPNQITWSPAAGKIDAAALERMDAVVHLSGESLEHGRWTPKRKEAIRGSRVESTRLLARTLAGLRDPPKVFLSVSAVGFYGNRGEQTLTETSAAGSGFLTDTCRAWEDAAEPAREAGIRVVHPRVGIVLSPAAGLLARLLRAGFPARFGSGKQWMSWVSLDDVLYALHHAMFTDTLQGPVNVVSPQPARNEDLAATLGRVLRRPGLPIPAGLLRAAFGEQGASLLDSARVVPAKLVATDYRFADGDLEAALRRCLGREVPRSREKGL